MSIWVMRYRQDFRSKAAAEGFLENLKKQGVKEVGISSYRDGFGKRQFTVHWDLDD